MAVKTIIILFSALYIVNTNAAKVWKNKDIKKNVVERYSNIHLVPQCAKKCALLSQCQTFAFLEEDSVCHLYDEKPTVHNLVNKTGSKLYTIEDFDLVQNLHGACSSSPCQNDGTCFEVDSDTGYVCDCSIGLGGQNCHIEVGTFEWDLWTDWAKCSVSCSIGWKQRRRKCINSKTGKTHSNQHCFGSPVDYVACNLKPCPVWQLWGEWEECTTERTCGRGQKTRRRACEHGGRPGKDKGCLGPTTEIAPCEYTDCDVPFKLSGSGSYGQGKVEVYNYDKKEWNLICPKKWDKKDGSVLCKYLGFRNGAHSAYSEATTKHNYLLGGFECKGSESSLVECIHTGWSKAGNCSEHQGKAAAVECIVDGHWQDWQSWGECSVSCANGTRYRQRKCNSPKAAHGGRACEGHEEEEESCTAPSCPVDGVWLKWSLWSACNLSCGGGYQTRQRICKLPLHGGKDCEGDSLQTQPCNIHFCPVDGVWVTWSAWSPCNLDCGGGIQWRNRSCDGPRHGGRPCPGSTESNRTCNTHHCPVDGEWLLWSDWTECSKSCGNGEQQRNRSCNGPFYGGQNCSGPSLEERNCNIHPCPVDGEWLLWSDWTECSKSCGNGEQQRNRSCNGPFYGGQKCSGPSLEERNCNIHPCPVDGEWLLWSDWTECSKSCGNGEQQRKRSCNGPFYGGQNCSGPSLEERNCNIHPCPVDGVWTPWTPWGECSPTCGDGSQSRSRTCTGPFYGGTNCIGLKSETQSCNINPCPVDGTWYPWGSWSGCDRSCNKGLRSRTRKCQIGMHGGKNCTGKSNEHESCNDFSCPVDGVWLEWSNFDKCTHTCDGGTQKRTRKCEGPFHGGKDCEGSSIDSKICNTQSCAVDGKWKEWQHWGECSKTCGPGAKIRTRDCDLPINGGKMCEGPAEEKMHCEEKPCPVDGVWLPWSKFGDCSVSCAGGVQWRSRVCEAPKHDGKLCDGPEKEQQICNTNACPVDGYWEEWNTWSSCSQTCGSEGKMTRSRTCNEPKHGGQSCQGSPLQEEACNEFPCPVDGSWSPWSRWLPCSASCGGGSQKRTRACGGISNGGKECEGDSEEVQACNEQKCPIDGKLDTWESWSECDVSCGGGNRNRKRHCIGPFHGGEDCKEALTESEECNTHNCPVDGIWKDWSLWDTCTLSCGNGTQKRNRECDGPLHGGQNCEGPTEETQPCFLKHCPVDGIWDKWSVWDVCSFSCGGGKQSRQRECIGPFHGGKQCAGGQSETQACNENPCPVDGKMGEWENWTKCSASCQGGIRTRKRVCDKPLHGGTPCKGETEQNEECNTHECPKDGYWLPWNDWEQCSVSCGGGTQIRNRVCVPPKYNGTDCVGINQESQNCNPHHCPVDGEWNGWTPWNECSTSCGGGKQHRSRICAGPFYGGAECPGSANDTQVCKTNPCPIPGDWMEWGLWDACSKTCDKGTRSRERKCDMQTHGELTAPCDGNSSISEACNAFPCSPIETTCSAWVNKGLVNSDYVQIDPDMFVPFWVYCNMTLDKRGVSVVHHNREKKTKVEGFEGAGEYVAELTYRTRGGQSDGEVITIDHLIALVDQSEECTQFIKWECKAALMTIYTHGSMTKMTFWENRWKDKMNYFGSAEQDSGVCGCNATNTCPGYACNCDKNDEVWREDSGNIIHKDDLPVTNFRAGDTGKIGDEEIGFHTVGPLECIG